MSDIERRKAANEAVFRNVNERIEALQHSFAVAEKEPLQMICECDQLDCMERVAIGVEAYELIRSQPDQFIVTPGHVDPSVERSVTQHRDHVLVQKLGDAAVAAIATDPR